MYPLNSLTNRFAVTPPQSCSTLSAGFSAQLSFGSILGAGTGVVPNFSSPLMQNLFGLSQCNPTSQLFQDFQNPCPSFGGGCSPTPNWGNCLGGSSYGCDPQSQYPTPPQTCHSSPCQNFGFGQRCSPCQRDYGCHSGPHRQTGQLEQEAEGKPINYTTSGGYQVSVDGHTINITDPNGNNTVKTWGDPHENVNGQHVSDWQEKQRTIVLDDGTKITMAADNPKGVEESMSIYDGRQSVQIDNKNNKVTGHSFNPFETRSLEQNQYDGSVAYLQNGSDGSLNFANYYTQDQDFNISRDYQLLATVDSGGQVTDHFDDPTHKNT